MLYDHSVTKVVQYPNACLRREMEDYDTGDDDWIFDVMRKALESCPNGVALAAPQVGISKPIFCVKPSLVEDFGGDEFLIYPEYVAGYDPSAAPKLLTYAEGCLSIPSIQALVQRAPKVTISYVTSYGSRKTLELEGLPSRIAQHEMDHLQGRLIIDHWPKAKRQQLAEQLAKKRRR